MQAGGWGEQPQQSGYLQRIQEQPMEQAGPAGQEEHSPAMPGSSDMGPGNWDPTYRWPLVPAVTLMFFVCALHEANGVSTLGPGCTS